MTDIRNRDDLIRCIDEGFESEYFFFWGHRPSADGSISKSCLSQWFEAPFVVDDVRYQTAEHFMMAGKARLFGDEAIRSLILSADTPDKAKRLGRRIAGFDDERWCAARFDIVVAGNLAKFSQHGRMRDFLLGTGDRILVEASPVDAIWGIGMSAQDPDASHPHNWRGLNLLGFALMEVRRAL